MGELPPDRSLSPPGEPSERRRRGYGNFKDPIGLAWRMLRHGGPEGRAALALEALQKLLAPVDWFLQPTDRRLQAGETLRSERPLLLVVGPPRSGTTVFAQVAASLLDVSVITNFNRLFGRSPLAAVRLFGAWNAARPRRFRSLFGNTIGLAGLNDGFHIWDRFLGPDRYRPRQSLLPEEARQLREFFAAWTRLADRPLLNKNNRNLACAAMLAEALPTAVFICMHRDRLAMAQSLLRARRWVQGRPSAGWGLLAVDSRDPDDDLAAVDAVARQLAAIEATVQEQRIGVAEERWFDVRYEEFCLAPWDAIAPIVEHVPGVNWRQGATPGDAPPLTPATQIDMPAAWITRLQSRTNERAVDKTTREPGESP